MATFLQNNVAIETALQGCPDLTAGRAVVIPAGRNSRICHEMRDNDGNPLDLGSFDLLTATEGLGGEDEPELVPQDHRAYFASVSCSSGPIVSTSLCVSEEDPSKVCFSVPDAVAGQPGIYNIELVLNDVYGRPFISDTMLLSVESSLLGRTLRPGENIRGPITIGQIRTEMRDYAGLNTYWQSVEFSDAEILHAIQLPVQRFNETAPRALRYSISNFPFRYHWLQAICACLLRISVAGQLRNNVKVNFGDGKAADERPNMAAYAQLAESRWAAYERFCVETQVTANYSGGSVHVGTYVQE